MSADAASRAERLALLPADERRKVLAQLGAARVAALRWDWQFWSRPAQRAPDGDWTTWLILAGRGFGKTRAGSEWVREQVMRHGRRRVALVARTAGDLRVMVEGESGILSISPEHERPRYNPSASKLTWPNGATGHLYTAETPDGLRGPEHDAAWCDELAAWRRPETWDMLLMGLRLPPHPRVCVTTTPRPTPLLKRIMGRPGTALTRGATLDNRANLAPTFFAEVVAAYEGTRLGRQELHGEVLEDVEGALWTQAMAFDGRVREAPILDRVVVAVDPAVTYDADADETGIVVAGVGRDTHGYVLEDLSGRFAPFAWAKRAIDAYHRHAADCIVAESNQGGEMVRSTLAAIDRSVPVRLVHAKRGKVLRAEPVVMLYEQGRVHHVGVLARLEEQMTAWVPGVSARSPDRVDALVYALTHAMGINGAVAPDRAEWSALVDAAAELPSAYAELRNRY